MHSVPAFKAGMGVRRHLGGGVVTAADTPERGRRKAPVHSVPAYKAGMGVRRHLGGGVVTAADTPETREEEELPVRSVPAFGAGIKRGDIREEEDAAA